MKKYYITFLVLIGCFTLNAQDITSVFLEIPENILPGLDAEARDRLVENPNDTSKIEVENAMNAQVERLAMSDDFIMLQTSSISTLQIKLLPLINKSKIICIINTVCGKACDSDVSFYTTDWTLLDDTNLFPSKNKDWFIKEDVDRDSQDFQNAYAALDFNPMKILIDQNTQSAEIVYDIEKYLSASDFKKIQPYLINQAKTLTWDKISYK